MFLQTNIAQHFRMVFLAITLLCVVSLNNREVNTFIPAKEAKTAHQVTKSASADRHGTIKQKVSFEATPSYVLLQLATCPEILPFVFSNPNLTALPTRPPVGLITTFFSRFLFSVIQPNAP